MTFIPYNQTLMGFGFRTFTFTGNYTDQIYLHCKAIICDEDEKTAQCDRSCAVHSGRRKRDVDTKKHLYDLQNGPLYFVNEAITVRGISGSKSSAVTTGHTIDQTGMPTTRPNSDQCKSMQGSAFRKFGARCNAS